MSLLGKIPSQLRHLAGSDSSLVGTLFAIVFVGLSPSMFWPAVAVESGLTQMEPRVEEIDHDLCVDGAQGYRIFATGYLVFWDKYEVVEEVMNNPRTPNGKVTKKIVKWNMEYEDDSRISAEAEVDLCVRNLSVTSTKATFRGAGVTLAGPVETKGISDSDEVGIRWIFEKRSLEDLRPAVHFHYYANVRADVSFLDSGSTEQKNMLLVVTYEQSAEDDQAWRKYGDEIPIPRCWFTKTCANNIPKDNAPEGDEQTGVTQ